MKRIIVLLSVLVVASGVAAFFYVRHNRQQPSNLIAVATSQGGALGFASEVVKRYKLDQKNGIDIDFKFFSPEQAEPALVNRVIDVGYFAPVSAARADIEGRDIRVFGAALLNHYSIVVKANSGINTLEELRGKKFGSFERYSGGYSDLATIFALRGDNLEKFFQITTGSPNALVEFLERGDVDAIMLFEPQTAKLVAQGRAKAIVSMLELWKETAGERPLLLLGFAAHKDWLEHHQDVARAITQSYYDAFKMIRENPSILGEQWAKETLGISSEAELSAIQRQLPKAYPTGWDRSYVDTGRFVIQKNVELGLIARSPDEDILVTLGE